MRLPDGDGAEVCRKLRQRVPGLRCLVLTSFPDEDAVAAAVAAGASGYVLKQVRGSALVTAVRTVADGGTLFYRAAQILASAARPRPAGRDRRLAGLTEPERI